MQQKRKQKWDKADNVRQDAACSEQKFTPSWILVTTAEGDGGDI